LNIISALQSTDEDFNCRTRPEVLLKEKYSKNIWKQKEEEVGPQKKHLLAASLASKDCNTKGCLQKHEPAGQSTD
jgi:hypothetical protein